MWPTDGRDGGLGALPTASPRQSGRRDQCWGPAQQPRRQAHRGVHRHQQPQCRQADAVLNTRCRLAPWGDAVPVAATAWCVWVTRASMVCVPVRGPSPRLSHAGAYQGASASRAHVWSPAAGRAPASSQFPSTPTSSSRLLAQQQASPAQQQQTDIRAVFLNATAAGPASSPVPAYSIAAPNEVRIWNQYLFTDCQLAPPHICSITDARCCAVRNNRAVLRAVPTSGRPSTCVPMTGFVKQPTPSWSWPSCPHMPRCMPGRWAES